MTDRSPRGFIVTIGAVLASIALFLAFDTALAGLDRRETTSHAAADFKEGAALMAAGKTSAATESFRAAWNLDRRRVEYPVALASAILAEGRAEDAENLLAPIVAANPTHGQVNLEMARVLVKERRYAESASYYHRAIYGLWPGESEGRRLAARFELIDLLAAHGSRRELLSELLPIQADSSVAKNVRRRMGHLFLVAGAPDRAAVIFRELLREDPTDADAYAGLAENAIARGSLETALADFRAAERFSPNDSLLGARIATLDSALALDPLRRGITERDAYARARRLLEITVVFLKNCPEIRSPGDLPPAIDTADKILAEPPPRRNIGDAMDQSVALAEELWKMAPPACASTGRNSGALDLVQTRISQ